MSNDFKFLHESFIAIVVESQLAFAELLGEDDEYEWELNLDQGSIYFWTHESEYTFNAQILGSESNISETWLWIWANDELDVPVSVLDSVQKVREFGRIHQINELTEAMFPLSTANGEALSIVSLGICDEQCFYRCPYEDGAAFILLRGVPLVYPSLASPRIISLFTRLFMNYDVNHKNTFAAYLAHKKLDWKQSEDTIEVVISEQDKLSAKFSSNGQLIEFSSVFPTS